MASIPPPHGLTETDYEAIEAAVTETVRGRWFLSEYARRNRLAETRQVLDAIARIETAVLAGQTALPSADPSIRLLIQRIKEISAQLNGVAVELRAAGIDDRLVEAVDMQARAVAGMMRSAAVGAPPPRSEARLDQPPRPSQAETQKPALGPTPAMPRMPRVEPLATPTRLTPNPTVSAAGTTADEDPRLAALADLDGLPLARKLALFT